MKKVLSVFLLLLLSAIARPVHAQALPSVNHVIIVMMENYSYSDIIGNPNSPYINALTSDPSTALFTQSYALTHPSQPNYLMLYSGSNQGVTTDVISNSTPFSSCNLGASLIAGGKTFMGYSESMPSDGYLGTTSGNYARKHNPWSNWQGSGTNRVSSTTNKMFSSFPSVANYSALPTVCFVVPNLVNDMHDPTNNATIAISTGDAWLNTNLGNLIQWVKSNNSLLILTWDEDDNTGGSNQIVTLFIGQMVQGGQYAEHVDHYRVLRTIEDIYNLPYCGASASTNPIISCWKTTTGIKQPGNTEPSCSIWPIPAKETANISIANANAGQINATLMDLSGRIIRHETFCLLKNSDTFQMNVHDVAPGTYLLKLDGQVNTCKKIIIAD